MEAAGGGVSPRGRQGSRWARGGHEVATKERDGAHGRLAFPHESRIGLLVCQMAELLAQLACGVQRGLAFMKAIETLNDPEALRHLSELLAQPMGSGEGLSRVRSPHALGGHPQLPQEQLERELPLGPLGALGQRREERQSCGEGSDRVLMGMPPCGVFPHLLPIVHRPRGLPAALEVRGQLDGHLPRPGAIAGLQPRANAPVQLPPPRTSQVLVEHLGVEGMLKAVPPAAAPIRPARHPGVIEEAMLHRQPVAHRVDLAAG